MLTKDNAKAVAMLDRGEEEGVFVWAPRLRYWLKEPDYVFWLGTNFSFIKKPLLKKESKKKA